jgi:hypothetical protein
MCRHCSRGNMLIKYNFFNSGLRVGGCYYTNGLAATYKLAGINQNTIEAFGN